MTVQLQPGVCPVGTIGPTTFEKQINKDASEYWNVPLEFFTVEGGKVYLKDRLASKLEWTIDEQVGDIVNIAAVPQSVTVADRKITVNPGFWCSHVTKADIRH
jgi:hypothetical protein